MSVVQVELLNGQKLQGVLASDEVQEVLRVRGWEVRITASASCSPPPFYTPHAYHSTRVLLGDIRSTK